MGCQREIARQIIDKGADCILALKGNQPGLLGDVELFVTEHKMTSYTDVEHSRNTIPDADHGRIETRRSVVLPDMAWLQERHNWPGLRAIIVIESTREIGAGTEQETRLWQAVEAVAVFSRFGFWWAIWRCLSGALGRLIGSGWCCLPGFGSGCGSGQQFRDTDEIAGGDGSGEGGVELWFATDFAGCEACCRLDPAMDFRDAFVAASADGVTAGASGPVVSAWVSFERFCP